jgi:TetR/AcrR family transcriptional repressor of uid operon
MQADEKVVRADARCRQVLDAAALCFAQNGFHGTSMTELARAAGMSVGHIYHYFDSKEALIAALVDSELRKQLARFETLRQQDDVLQALVDGAEEGLAARLDPTQAGLRLEILAEAGRNPKIAAVVQAADDATRRTLRDVVAKALPGSVPARALDARVELVIAIFEGMMIRAVRHPALDRAGVLAALKPAIRHILAPDRGATP